MNAKFSVFVICVEAIIYLLLYNLRDCTFKHFLCWQNEYIVSSVINLVSFKAIISNLIFGSLAYLEVEGGSWRG